MTPFSGLKFIYPWRTYQARILDELDTHLGDDKLHVVAAPGSGKTVLGLEVMLRLNKPTLILAPTLAIRNQWVDRLLTLFGAVADGSEAWISRSVRAPNWLTVSTYQGLHAALTGAKDDSPPDEADLEEEAAESVEEAGENRPGEEIADTVIAGLKAAGISVMVLDEAHHLRREWWKALDRLQAELAQLQTVSLTATPPFDVEPAEWRRYEELCGPVDHEVAVPELVQAGDLCPHQDYVHFSVLKRDEAQALREFNRIIAEVSRRAIDSAALRDAVLDHPWIQSPQEHTAQILEAPSLYSAYVIYLNATGLTPPQAALQVLGLSSRQIPGLNPAWLELFLTALLFEHETHFEQISEELKALRRTLKRCGAIERRRVMIEDARFIGKLLASSLNKLNSVEAITRMEADAAGDDLRLVILNDYIRLSEMPRSVDDVRAPAKLGVVPVFEQLRRAGIAGLKLGVLTGSLVIIPASAQAAVTDAAQSMGLDADSITMRPLEHDNGFIQLRPNGSAAKRMVELVTALFQAGHINTLSGTQSLLGEGWDAPTINTLILASSVGSYMLSNQMRGRAIRIDPDRPEKTANIWHLACVDTEGAPKIVERALKRGMPMNDRLDAFDEVRRGLGHDVNRLRRRFKSFEGVTYLHPWRIETGMRRLDLAEEDWTSQSIDALNAHTLNRARDRASVRQAWHNALDIESPVQLERIETGSIPLRLTFMRTLKHFIITGITTGAALGLHTFARGLDDGGTLASAFVVGLSVAAVASSFYLLKAAWLWFRNGSIERHLAEIGRVIVDCGKEAGLIETRRDKITVRTIELKDGRAACRVYGLPPKERAIIYDALEELLNPIENPRYLIERKTFLSRWIRTDYHPVPSAFARKKELAERFADHWQRRVDEGRLVYTRTTEGRQLLLKARAQSYAAETHKRTSRFSAWE